MRIGVDYNQAPQRPLSFWEQWQIMEILSQYPALTLKVLMHRRVGLRRADPIHVLLMAAILGLIALNIHNLPLGLFALAVAAAGCWQHFNRWKELRGEKAAPWHTFSEGVSPLEDLIVRKLEAAPKDQTAPAAHSQAGLSATAPLPPGEPPQTMKAASAGKQAQAKAAAMMKNAQSPTGLAWLAGESRIYRRVEPVTIGILGFILYVLGFLVYDVGATAAQNTENSAGFLHWLGQQSQALSATLNPLPLGIWLMFSASCLATNESLKWRHQVRAYLDWYDGQIDGAAMREWGGKKGQRRVQSAASRRQTYGLPTGIGNDIRASVERQAQGIGRPPAEPPKPSQENDPGARRAAPEAETVPPAPDNRVPNSPPESPDQDREWDAVNGRYYTRSASEAESARANAARETWDLPVSPDESETDKTA